MRVAYITSALKMEAIRSPEMSVAIYKSTRRHNPHCQGHLHHREMMSSGMLRLAVS